MIERLPLLTPSELRGHRTIARCHARLARRCERPGSPAGQGRTRYLALELALVGGLCVIYMAVVMRIALQVLAGS